MPTDLKSIADAPFELLDEIVQYSDWNWDEAASISWEESGWNWDSFYDSTQDGTVPCGTIVGTIGGETITAERSISYFQLNSCNYPEWPWWNLMNVHQNVGTAHALWVERGWSPWYFSAQKLGLL